MMRIVGGKFRGKKLLLPVDKRIRPTSDRTREALFNILAHDGGMRSEFGALPHNARVLDVFAGTGALGLEALSREAKHVTFIDNHPQSLKLIKENVQNISATGAADMLNRDGAKPGIAGEPYDLILLDPPYQGGLVTPCIKGLLAGNWLKPAAVMVVELAAKEAFTAPDTLDLLKERTYGAARLLFFKLR
ncbi:16S rRNA (guanine(966)-N(2))-methyltransferase RsmD [Sneathiella sp.]|uniref:16S rRNA (guanine(966)-N(2))-methyltransferase RsmD n=1 Tax=Sneathiella sp. TaxID=1964365 RepID=UPI0035673611